MSVEKKFPHFEELIYSYLGDQTVVKSYKVKDSDRSSRVVEVEVSLSDGSTLNLVAKLLPKSNEERLNSQSTFPRELTFYSVVLPTLKHFQKRDDLDELYFIPEYYGGRSSLDSSNGAVDANAILLFENLKVQGYENVEELDLATSRQALKDLASLHAVPLALKIKDGKVFEIKLKRHLSKRTIQELRIEQRQLLVKIVLKALEKEPECVPFLSRVEERLQAPVPDRAPRVPFSTMIHCDFCTKNIMVKTSSNGYVDVKVMDFKTCSYGSVAEDLIFFLYGSVGVGVLEEHVDGLIEFYHSNFVRVLEECKCNPTHFSIEGFLKEMKIVASESQFAHIMFTLYLGSVEDSGSGEIVSDTVRQRLVFVVKDFAQRGWI